MSQTPPQFELADFRGEFDALAELMDRSWAAQARDSLRYTPAFLRSMLAYPGASRHLAPTFYHGAQPVAFTAAFPRTLRLGGRTLRIALSSLTTSAPEYGPYGLGTRSMWAAASRARELGYDGTIAYYVDGSRAHQIGLKTAAIRRQPLVPFFSIGYLTRLIRPAQRRAPEPASEHALTVFLELANRIGDHVPLARVWTREEALWQCREREGAVCVLHESEGRRGMLTGYVMEVLDSPSTRCLIIDDILWGDLMEEEQAELLKQILAQGAAVGATLATVPLLGYASLTPFAQAGFGKSRRLLHGVLTLWSVPLPPLPLPAAYVDAL